MRVLVADDSPTVRALLSNAVASWGYEPIQAVDGADAWRQLESSDAPRLALLDWEMPGLDGIDVCRRIRERESGDATYTYVLLLTARGAKADVVAGMDAGADDYVVKPFDDHELRVRLRAGQRIVALQAELYRLKEAFRLQSRTDPLTGCLNRRAVLERLEAEVARARREHRPLSVGMIDLDHFKRINDTHGHAGGDDVLRELVQRLHQITRASDTFGRVGGEEFLVVWPGADETGAVMAGERLASLVSGAPFPCSGAALAITASIGVATTAGDEAAEAVVARADEALYQAKRLGRNRVEAARPRPPPDPAVDPVG